MKAQCKSVFRAQSIENYCQQVRKQINTSDTIPLDGFGTIYSFSIDAIIQQPREASFTRIVLEDKDGHDYLVAESDWCRFDTTIVNIDHYCEETAILNGVIPVRLKCYIAGGANLTLCGLNTSNQPVVRNNDEYVLSAKNLKEAQTQDIVTRINAYNDRHGKLWQAGVTNASLKNYSKLKEDSTSYLDSYLNNLKYYIGGYYEFGERQQQRITSTSPYIKSFDWRNRHGRNWLTPVKNQGSSGMCTAFAAVAVTEAAARLYFNILDNIDLSEYAVGYYSGVDYYSGIHTNWKHYPIQYIRDYGAVDELTVPFPDHPITMPSTCPSGNECMRITDYKTIPANIAYVDSIKSNLIQYGPAQSGFHNSNHNHAMTLVGYGEITTDTIYHFIYQFNKDTIYSQSSNMIGKDFWILKNSYGVNDGYGHNGYAYFVFNDYQYMHEAFFPITPIQSLIYSDNDIVCEDLDGDGYFNWGIGSKPSHCPAWAPDEPDGDDSDATKGPMDEYGYCEELPSNHPSYEYIDNDSILTVAENRTSYLGVVGGATVTLQAQQTFANGTKLLLDNGTTLILDGIILNSTYIQPYAGSKIILNNGAKISKPFEVPLGVQLVINRGAIE